MFLTVLPLLYLLLGFINLLGKCSRTCLRLSQYLNNLLLWNFMINFYFSQFTPVILPCLINLRSTSKASLIEAVSLYLTCFLVSAFTVILLVMYFYIKRQPPKIESHSYLLTGLRLSDSFIVRNWKLLVLIRLYLTLLILVFMQDKYMH